MNDYRKELIGSVAIVSVVLSPIVVLPALFAEEDVGLFLALIYIGSGLWTYVITGVTLVLEDESPTKRILTRERISYINRIVQGLFALLVLTYVFWLLP